MEPHPSYPICYLDPTVEDAFSKPGEILHPVPVDPNPSLADDLAEEWNENGIRPPWLDSL